MEDKKIIRYPVGQQSFEVLRERDCLYVDKTMYLKKLIDGGSQYFFLARPRRFGKSLFLSMMKCFFEGKRELFKGLYIDSTDWDWEPVPVIRIDLNVKRYEEKGGLGVVLDDIFHKYEIHYNINVRNEDHNVRLKNIIETAHRATGKKVVILVDEYDKPLVGNLNDKENFEHYREKLASIYSNFKNSAEHIRMVFLTGVSRFSKLTIFSGLNNLKDITFNDEFSDICGISEKELYKYFDEGIHDLAKNNDLTYEEACDELKRNYDGYKFSPIGSDMYNPWSVLQAMDDKKFENYWNETGVPTLIAQVLKRTRVDLESFFEAKCNLEELKGLDLQTPRPVALLYQTGYLTIKSYNPRTKRYTLGLPNREIKEGMMQVLLPYYANLNYMGSDSYVWQFIDYIDEGKPEAFMKELQSFFAGIPYEMGMADERNVHNALYVFLTLLGLKTYTEVHTSEGRLDLLIESEEYVYIIELKFDGSAEAALHQIEEKNYALPWQTKGKKIVQIGVNFSSQTRTIKDWVIQTD